MGRNFHGCYDVIGDRLVLMKKGNAAGALAQDPESAAQCDGVDDPALDGLLPKDAVAELRAIRGEMRACAERAARLEKKLRLMLEQEK